MNALRIGISAVLLSVVLGFSPQDKKPKKECPCKDERELTQDDLLCMNSCAKIYSCLTGETILPEQVFSYAFMIYTGEETIINRYDKDELPLIVRNNLRKAKKFVIRGVRLQNEFGEPTGVYLSKPAKIKFRKREIEEN